MSERPSLHRQNGLLTRERANNPLKNPTPCLNNCICRYAAGRTLTVAVLIGNVTVLIGGAELRMVALNAKDARSLHEGAPRGTLVAPCFVN